MTFQRPEMPETTRIGYPTLWGNAEMTQYANKVLAQLGRPPLHRGRAWTWDLLEGFPKPVARLEMGKVYLAHEVMPWIDERMMIERASTVRIPDSKRAAVLADRGTMTLAACAKKHEIGASSVSRIWNGR